MNSRARQVIAVIRDCITANRFLLLAHFRQRMADRGMVWPDVMSIIDAPWSVRYARKDQFGRDKWMIRGRAGDGLPLEIVCVLDIDEYGDVVVFITIF